MAKEISPEMIAANLPMDIITEIISRVPVEPLLRFRCVSKRWCSLIDTSDFAKLHLNRSIKTKSNLSLILGDWGRTSVHSVSFDKLDEAVKVEHPIEEPFVAGSCNGLVLLTGSLFVFRHALYNPATRRHKVIPDCLIPPGDYGMQLGAYGLGYDALNDDFKIISVIAISHRKSGQWIRNGTYVYSLKSDKWKPMKDFPYKVFSMKVWCVHMKGALHTPVKRNGEDKCPDAILVTDLCKEDYGFMELPCFPEEDVGKLTLCVLGVEECLCCQIIYKNDRTDFWVMKEYGVTSSWTKLLSVSPMDLPPMLLETPLDLPPSGRLDLLTYSKEYDKVLCTLDGEKFCWYDLKSKAFIDIPVQGLPEPDLNVHICVGSLIRPDGFRKPKENETKKKRDDFLSKGFKLKL